jgi:hypothetical protein
VGRLIGCHPRMDGGHGHPNVKHFGRMSAIKHDPKHPRIFLYNVHDKSATLYTDGTYRTVMDNGLLYVVNEIVVHG